VKGIVKWGFNNVGGDERMKLVPCKHLDYESHYDAELRTDSVFPQVKYWHRTDVHYEGAPVDVQYCKKCGRVNGIYQCYTGELDCYEPCEEG